MMEGEQTVLVTGGPGFLGGWCLVELLQRGYRARTTVRDLGREREVRANVGSQVEVGDRLTVLAADLTDDRGWAEAVDGCDYVFHCGALVSDWATRKEIEQTNVQGTRSLLSASVDASVRRFIHFSTTDVYGYPGGAAVDETHRSTRFRNWYAQTKRDAESEVRRVEADHALDAVILRPATVYGPGSKDVVGEIARAIRARNMLLVDGGRAVAGLCYVDNLLDAALLALRHERAGGQAFNVSDGLAVTWREFTDAIADGLGYAKVRWSVPYWLAHGVGFSLEHGYRLLRRTVGLHAPPLLSRQAVHVLAKDQDFSSRRAREVLGWHPRVDYSTGLQATVDWLRAEYLKQR